MSDELEDLLREHYRRAAGEIQPDAGLLSRYRGAARPARATASWSRVLLAAAAVAAVALVTWGLLRSPHRSTPVAPPPVPATGSPSPDSRPPTPVPRTPVPASPTPSVRPSPTGLAVPTRPMPTLTRTVPPVPVPSATPHGATPSARPSR